MATRASPTAFQKTSPLDSIVDGNSEKQSHGQVLTQSPVSYDYESLYSQQPSNLQIARTPRSSNNHLQSPVSPLLHGRFSRYSTATLSSTDNNSFLDRSSSFDSRNPDNAPQYHYNDDESIYSSYTPLGPAPRESWHSGASTETVRQTAVSYSPNYIDIDSLMLELSPNKFIPQRAAPQPPVPTVVVSTPVALDYEPGPASRGGRSPIVRPITSNYSRPVRAPPSFSHPRTPLPSPPLPSDSQQEAQKRLVLERNRPNTRPNTPLNSPSQPFNSQGNSLTVLSKGSPSSPNLPLPSIVVQPWKQETSLQKHAMRSPSPQSFATPYQRASPGSPNIPTTPAYPSSSYSESGLSSNYASSSRPSAVSNYSSPSQHLNALGARSSSPSVPSSNYPGSSDNIPSGLVAQSFSKREGSPVSLYSNYSYYPYDNAIPSPTAGSFQSQEASSHGARLQAHFQPPSKAASHNAMTGDRVPLSEATASTPQDFLQLGIQHHEANRLQESAACFEKSAKSNGGCGVGMLMWGLALRHGWGCEKNEKLGFKWLQKAAEHAVEDLESSRGGTDVGAVQVSFMTDNYVLSKRYVSFKQTELLLAIYEVGQCFFQGWGVPKDQKMAVVSLFSVSLRILIINAMFITELLYRRCSSWGRRRAM